MSYKKQCQSVKGKSDFVGARLAGEGVLKSAFAGKPGSYEKRFTRLTDWHCPPRAFFVLKSNSLGKPGLDSGGAEFRFPFPQCLLVAALGLDDFASVWIFVDLHLARLARAGFRRGC